MLKRSISLKPLTDTVNQIYRLDFNDGTGESVFFMQLVLNTKRDYELLGYIAEMWVREGIPPHKAVRSY